MGLGLAPDPALDMLQRDLVLVPCPPELPRPGLPVADHGARHPPCGPRADVRRVRATPMRGCADLARRRSAGPGSRPVVYATLGTIFNMESGDLLRRIVDGLTGLAGLAGSDRWTSR